MANIVPQNKQEKAYLKMNKNQRSAINNEVLGTTPVDGIAPSRWVPGSASNEKYPMSRTERAKFYENFSTIEGSLENATSHMEGNLEEQIERAYNLEKNFDVKTSSDDRIAHNNSFIEKGQKEAEARKAEALQRKEKLAEARDIRQSNIEKKKLELDSNSPFSATNQERIDHNNSFIRQSGDIKREEAYKKAEREQKKLENMKTRKTNVKLKEEERKLVEGQASRERIQGFQEKKEFVDKLKDGNLTDREVIKGRKHITSMSNDRAKNYLRENGYEATKDNVAYVGEEIDDFVSTKLKGPERNSPEQVARKKELLKKYKGKSDGIYEETYDTLSRKERRLLDREMRTKQKTIKKSLGDTKIPETIDDFLKANGKEFIGNINEAAVGKTTAKEVAAQTKQASVKQLEKAAAEKGGGLLKGMNVKKMGRIGATIGVGALLVSNMSKNKGQQPNQQLYGQQTPYSY